MSVLAEFALHGTVSGRNLVDHAIAAADAVATLSWREARELMAC